MPKRLPSGLRSMIGSRKARCHQEMPLSRRATKRVSFSRDSTPNCIKRTSRGRKGTVAFAYGRLTRKEFETPSKICWLYRDSTLWECFQRTVASRDTTRSLADWISLLLIWSFTKRRSRSARCRHRNAKHLATGYQTSRVSAGLFKFAANLVEGQFVLLKEKDSDPALPIRGGHEERTGHVGADGPDLVERRKQVEAIKTARNQSAVGLLNPNLAGYEAAMNVAPIYSGWYRMRLSLWGFQWNQENQSLAPRLRPPSFAHMRKGNSRKVEDCCESSPPFDGVR